MLLPPCSCLLTDQCPSASSLQAPLHTSGMRGADVRSGKPAACACKLCLPGSESRSSHCDRAQLRRSSCLCLQVVLALLQERVQKRTLREAMDMEEAVAAAASIADKPGTMKGHWEFAQRVLQSQQAEDRSAASAKGAKHRDKLRSHRVGVGTPSEASLAAAVFTCLRKMSVQRLLEESQGSRSTAGRWDASRTSPHRGCSAS